MDLDFGGKIKSLRIGKGLTQEELGRYLGVSYQAISKWETNIAIPDIMMFPKLSVYFGVSIDELFSVNTDDKYLRFDNMLDKESNISDEQFIFYERYFKGLINEDNENVEALRRLSKLYSYRVGHDRLAMGRYAEIGLNKSPFDQELHGLYTHARNVGNELDRAINFYEKFVHEYPDWIQGYKYLIEWYIKGGKTDKAKSVLNIMEAKDTSAENAIYRGDIEKQMGNLGNAIGIWQGVATMNSNNHNILCNVADRLVNLDMVDEAIKLYETAYDISENHYLDSVYARAFLYDNLGRPEDAIKMWELILHDLKVYHGTTEGKDIEWPEREIDRLKKGLSYINYGLQK